jgi:hypothetical protein
MYVPPTSRKDDLSAAFWFVRGFDFCADKTIKVAGY